LVFLLFPGILIRLEYYAHWLPFIEELSGASAMFGIEDKGVSAVYLLCIASSALCVVYGLINWNRGEDKPRAEDVQWAEQEKRVEDEL